MLGSVVAMNFVFITLLWDDSPYRIPVTTKVAEHCKATRSSQAKPTHVYCGCVFAPQNIPGNI